MGNLGSLRWIKNDIWWATCLPLFIGELEGWKKKIWVEPQTDNGQAHWWIGQFERRKIEMGGVKLLDWGVLKTRWMGGREVRRSEPINRLFVVKPAQTDPTISDAPPDDTSYCAAETLYISYCAAETPLGTTALCASVHCSHHNVHWGCVFLVSSFWRVSLFHQCWKEG